MVSAIEVNTSAPMWIRGFLGKNA